MAKPHPTVQRVVAVLEAVASTPGTSLAELVRRVEIPKSTAHTLIQGLLAADYLSLDDAGAVRIGPRVGLLTAMPEEAALRRAAHTQLQVVAARLGETAQLGVRSDGDMLVIDQVESQHEIRYAVKPRARRPMLTTSMGKLFLAEFGDADLDVFLRAHGGRRSRAARTLLAQLDAIRRDQVAVNDEESVTGVFAVSAALRSHSGMLLAAVTAAGPAYRMRPQREKAVATLTEAARRVNAHLHGT